MNMSHNVTTVTKNLLLWREFLKKLIIILKKTYVTTLVFLSIFYL